MNARSVANKTTAISDYASSETDILAITETWMKTCDPVIATELTPPGFLLHHVPRLDRVGGEVAILYRSYFKLIEKENPEMTSFESAQCTFKTEGCKSLTLLVIYRPPSSNFTTFLDEFATCLENLIPSPNEIIILGDFNVHYDDTSDHQANHLKSLLIGFSLQQHISDATHLSGHTLDLVISRQDKLVLTSTAIDLMISDHKVIEISLDIDRPRATRKIFRVEPELSKLEVN